MWEAAVTQGSAPFVQWANFGGGMTRQRLRSNRPSSSVGCGDSGRSSDGERMGQGGGVSCGGDRGWNGSSANGEWSGGTVG